MQVFRIMKKWSLKIALFFILVTCVDFGFGKLCSYLVQNTKKGDTAHYVSMLYRNQYNVLVMGSSRSVCHYDDTLMQNRLQTSVLNAGEKGNGIILMYGRYHILSKYYKPDVLIYDIEPSFDIVQYEKDDNNRRYLEGLKLFYEEDGIDSLFKSVDWKYTFLMRSALYRYNSNVFALLRDGKGDAKIDFSGYNPSFNIYKPTEERNTEVEREKDLLKLHYIEQLIIDTKRDGVKLIMVASPKYGMESSASLCAIKQLCDKYNVPFWDYYADSTYVDNPNFFCDAMHLNNDGAQKFTRMICDRILFDGGLIQRNN